jgi:hypothetical protein
MLLLIKKETLLTVSMGRALAQVISRRPFTAEARVRTRVNPRGICGGQSGTVVLSVAGRGPTLSPRVFYQMLKKVRKFVTKIPHKDQGSKYDITPVIIIIIISGSTVLVRTLAASHRRF